MQQNIVRLNIKKSACLLATLVLASCGPASAKTVQIRGTPGSVEAGSTMLLDGFNFPEVFYRIKDNQTYEWLNISYASNTSDSIGINSTVTAVLPAAAEGAGISNSRQLARTEDLPNEGRPGIYVESDRDGKYQTWAAGSAANGFIEISGGKNIFADTPGDGSVDIDSEEVVEKNPDIIIKYIDTVDAGYEFDDPSKVEVLRKSVMNRPELVNVKAVKNGVVYVMDKDPIYEPDYPVAIAYWAKWSHPDLFEDPDPQAIHQKYIDIQGLDYDLNEHGVFIYPLLEEI